MKPDLDDGFLVMRDKDTQELTLAVDLRDVTHISKERDATTFVLLSKAVVTVVDLGPQEVENQVLLSWSRARRK